MAKKQSAGILMYRFGSTGLEVFLVHPGGPFWSKKDDGAWSIPKGEFDDGDDPMDAARREFTEETGFTVDGPFIELTSRRQPSGKVIHAWAVEGDCDASAILSNTFTMEWPPKSGKQAEFPEVDRAGWFAISLASQKLLPAQVPFLRELQERLAGSV